MNQFVELIYVSLYELADLLSIMRQYLTPGWLYTEEMNTTKFHSVPKIVPLRLPTEELNTTSSHMTSEDYHQDICPENVIMTGDFSLKLAYFPTIPNLIGGQRYEGVEKYGRAEWDESFKNQVYSIGLIIWEIIERRRVFEEYDRDGKFQVDQLHQDLKTGKFLLPWPKCESRLAVIVELCTRLNLDDRPGSSDAFDLPYSKISQHASNKKEPQALKMKIREDERCLIRPIGFDGTENEDNPKVSRNPQKRHVILYFDGEVE
ncbi:unnamed protein product, partial [Mesorhabditis belari]|uniref:Protein kinase domain-containing protein n=1 Tax=Mesorhabditis belari TaxID=2138241 RepID=A0AAF3J3S4_9BILA